jgi:predicted ATP-grasp superfamily ATP-dependent carboligase
MSMRRFDTSTPVVVLRCSRHGGLGITRSLGRMGVPVYLIDSEPLAPAFHSRYARGHFIWDTDTASPDATIGFLIRVAGEIGGRPILIPTSDATAMLVADHATALAPHYRFPKPGAAMVRAFCSKRGMFLLAKHHQLPTPETAFPRSRRELLQYSDQMRFPLIVKGTFASDLKTKGGKRMFIVRDRRRLLELYDAHQDWFQPECVLQEFIPGPPDAGWMFNGYFDQDSHCLAGFTGWKIRQYPVDSGLTTLGECRWNPVIASLSREFLKTCGYQGMVDIDFRFDERDGRYKVVDINPRVGATFRLFVDEGGTDIVRAMYFDLTGQPLRTGPAPDGRRWCVEDCDLLSCLHSIWARTLSPFAWVRSHCGVVERGIFASDDPLPLLWTALSHVRRLWTAALNAHAVEVPVIQAPVQR